MLVWYVEIHGTFVPIPKFIYLLRVGILVTLASKKFWNQFWSQSQEVAVFRVVSLIMLDELVPLDMGSNPTKSKYF